MQPGENLQIVKYTGPGMGARGGRQAGAVGRKQTVREAGDGGQAQAWGGEQGVGSMLQGVGGGRGTRGKGLGRDAVGGRHSHGEAANRGFHGRRQASGGISTGGARGREAGREDKEQGSKGSGLLPYATAF